MGEVANAGQVDLLLTHASQLLLVVINMFSDDYVRLWVERWRRHAMCWGSARVSLPALCRGFSGG